MDDNYAPLLTTEAKNPIDNAANTTTETESDDASSHLNKQILCKPALEAIKAAIKIANVDPRRTVILLFTQYSAYGSSPHPLPLPKKKKYPLKENKEWTHDYSFSSSSDFLR